MRKPCSETRFRESVENLRAVCPPPRRTRVVVARGSPESLGESWPADISKARAAFRINIGDDLTDIETDDALVHEWAHMMTWAPYHPLSQDHDEVWGVWYARILRAYMRIN